MKQLPDILTATREMTHRGYASRRSYVTQTRSSTQNDLNIPVATRLQELDSRIHWKFDPKNRNDKMTDVLFEQPAALVDEIRKRELMQGTVRFQTRLLCTNNENIEPRKAVRRN